MVQNPRPVADKNTVKQKQTMKGNSDDRENPPNVNLLSSVSRFIDDYKRPITYSFYFLGAAGVVTVLRSARIFTQFKNAKEIPSEFVEKKMSIFGVTQSHSWIPFNNEMLKPVLKVQHLPIVGRGLKEDYLSVRVAGVGVPAGIKAQAELWMDSNLNSKKVKVRLLSIDDEAIEATVLTKRWMLWRRCVGTELVREGLARPVEDRSNITDSWYIDKLKKAEDRAKWRGKGEWRDRQELGWRRWINWLKRFRK